MDAGELWAFLPRGYLISIAIETPFLLIGLSQSHSLARRLWAGIWLTACSYPIVVLVLPVLLANRTAYLAVAETFAPLSECLIFAAAYHRRSNIPRRQRWQDIIAIVLANLASFLLGEWMRRHGGLPRT
jgi:hypothetical protein